MSVPDSILMQMHGQMLECWQVQNTHTQANEMSVSTWNNGRVSKNAFCVSSKGLLTNNFHHA